MLSILYAADEKLRAARKVELVNATVLWAFRQISAAEYGRRLNKMTGTKVARVTVTTTLLQSERFLRYKVELVSGRLGKVTRRIWPMLAESTQKLLQKLRTPTTISLVRAERERCLAHIKTWLAKFVWRKLRFIEKQRVGVELEDLKQDLTIRAMQGYAAMWPFMQTELHAINTMKRTAHNYGINLIKHYTSQKRGSSAGDGNFRVVTYEVQKHDNNSVQLDELKIDVGLVISKYKGVKRLFIQLLMGHYSKKFSEWLKKDNDVFAQRAKPDTYIAKISEWLHLKKEAAMRFVNKLRDVFGEYAK